MTLPINRMRNNCLNSVSVVIILTGNLLPVHEISEENRCLFFKFPCKNGFQICFREQHIVGAINFHVHFFCFYNFSLLSITCMRRTGESLISQNSVHATFFLFPLADIKAEERAVFFCHSHEHASFL